MKTEYFTYTNETGQKITVYIIEDCGEMKNQWGNTWHKVLCKPIGFNNAPVMSLDKNKLVKQDRAA